MRFGLHDPFLDQLGGGEKYVLTILEEALRHGEADVFSDRAPDVAAWDRLGVTVDPTAVRWRRRGQLGVVPATRGLDVFVALANHFPPLSLARRSFAVVQFPFTAVGGPPRSWDRRWRLSSYDTILCYSEFVRDHIRERLARDAVVLPPPVEVDVAVPVAKEQRIVSVGRFFPARDQNNKKHDVLIRAFRALAAAGWTLHLVGGLADDPAAQAHLTELRHAAEDVAVEFHPNASRAEVEDLYGRATLFWHAAGLGELDPARHEHFGITAAEAMAHGTVPLVPAVGGQVEVVADGVTGVAYGTEAELVRVTRELIADPSRTATMAAAGREAVRRYSREAFLERVRSEVLGVTG